MIWCVEDDSSIRDIEIYTLLSTGFEAKGFEDGKSAWKALKSEKPELILLDVMLPEMDGIELLKKIKDSSSLCDIPVIMATAKGSEYDKVKSLDMGADYIGESRTVDMHIRTLRQKLGEYGEMIETVRNVGYRMETQG